MCELHYIPLEILHTCPGLLCHHKRPLPLPPTCTLREAACALVQGLPLCLGLALLPDVCQQVTRQVQKVCLLDDARLLKVHAEVWASLRAHQRQQHVS